MFIASTQHVAHPKGQELTFSKCLRRLLFLCGERGAGGAIFCVFSRHLEQLDCANKSAVSLRR